MKKIVVVISIILGFFVMMRQVGRMSMLFIDTYGFNYWFGKFFSLVLSFWIGVVCAVLVYLLAYLIPKTIIRKLKKK